MRNINTHFLNTDCTLWFLSKRVQHGRWDKGVTFQVASLAAQLVKNLSAMQETWVQSLGWEDPLRREWLSTPVFWPCIVHGSQRVGHDWATFTHFSQVALLVKNLPAIAGNIRDADLIPGSGRSPPRPPSPPGGHGDPLQYSCVENPTEEPGGLQSMV